MPTLVVKYKDGMRTYLLKEGVPAFIGRAKECDIHLPSPAVSRRHAVVIFKNGICGVKDLGSFNGTLINGKALTSAQHMTDADVVQISSFVIRLDASDIGLGESTRSDAERSRNTTAILNAEDRDAAAAGAFDPAAPPQDAAAAQRMREAAAKYKQDGARAFSGSNILLPRAMEPAGDVEDMLEDIPPDAAPPRQPRAAPAAAPAAVDAGAPGERVQASPDDMPFSPHYIPDGSPDGTVEMGAPAGFEQEPRNGAQDSVDTASEFDFVEAPAAGGASAPAGEGRRSGGTSARIRDGGGWFETDYFRDGPGETVFGVEPDAGAAPAPDLEDPFAHEEPEPPEPPPLAREDPPATPEAEQLIPMHDPEYSPRLKLDWDDDEANRALETLVADVSPAVTAFRNSRLAELGLSGDDAMQAFSEAVGDDASPGGDAPPGDLAALDEIEPPAPPAAEGADSPDATHIADPLETPMDPEEKRRDAAFDTVSIPIPAALAGTGVPGGGVFAAGKTAIPGVDAIVVTPGLMAAMEKRLALYDELAALADERAAIRGANETLSPEAEAELRRQDEEAGAIPSADEADKMLAALAARREGEEGADDPVLRRAEELAAAQWTRIRNSAKETLPLVYKEAYKFAADELLAREFAAARINHGRLMGGAIYLLALEGIAESAEAERRGIAEEMRRLGDRGLDKDAGGILGRLGVIGDTVNKVKNRTEIRERSQSLEEQDRQFAAAAERANREAAFVEKAMNREFRMVFMQAARHFGSRDDMPVAVRAFLRYGVVGFKSWWMRSDIRDFIVRDCTDNVLHAVEPGPGKTIVLHADEYIAAVANMECPPLPDDSAAGREKNSAEWLTDRAFRRIVNANSYNILMDDMLCTLDAKLQEYDDKSSAIELRVAELRDWSASDNQDEMFSLQTEQQVIAIRYENMQRHIKRIEKEVVASILEAVEDSEGRFRRGELRMPDSETLVARESSSLAVMAKRIGGARQRFTPMAVRGQTSPAAFNDRRAVAGRLGVVEKFDPGVFVSAIVPAKKKENRVELRLSPVVVIFPCAGARGIFSTPRDGMEGGHLIVPVCFTKRDMAETAFASLLADFRWETSRLQGGQDVEQSDTLAGAFMRFRREFAEEPKARREKGYIFTELTDKRNWRRVYAAFLADAQNSTRRLPARNPGLYENVIAPYLG